MSVDDAKEEELSSSDESLNEDFEEIYEGQRNDYGKPHGRGTLYFDPKRRNGFQGHFRNGLKQGKGRFFFADGSSLSGYLKDDCLEGRGEYLYDDGSRMVGTYKNGELNGPSQEYDDEGHKTFDGNYKDNARYGVCQFFMKYGGCVFGLINKEGKLTGKDVVYAYPDGETFLKGQFEDGEMLTASEALFHGLGDSFNPYSYSKLANSREYSKDVSSATIISSHPLLSDCYEDKRVTVKNSIISDAGEGLFSLIATGPGEVMSFYNGIRISHETVDSRDWKYNDNTISLDEDTVIDVPENLSSLVSYKASLGHKANHSFNPNCKYDRFDHPRFGKIKCIRTISSVEIGDELTVAYGYDHTKLETEAPDWYKEKLSVWKENADKSRTCGS